jgi:hypothetical protein
MAGSRAVGAREPGQVREEAALSDTAHAPRTSLTGAKKRRARPGAGLDGGCTVHLGQSATTASISTRAPRGRAATSIATRAGGSRGKNSA